MKLVVFEGIDGSGKSTQARLLEERIRASKPAHWITGVVRVAEPTDSPHGKKIRELMMNSNQRPPVDEELRLFLEDRRYNVERTVKPALARGEIVILDRYYFSTAAYQGARGKYTFQEIIDMNEAFAPVPDLVFFFFIPVDEALQRVDKDNSRSSRSYMERKDNLAVVQEIFKEIHESRAYNSVAIDATRPVNVIHEEVWSSFVSLLGTNTYQPT